MSRKKVQRPVFPIGLAGNANSGKDSIFKLVESNGIKCKRVSLGDKLKAITDDFTKETFGISSFTTNRDEKDLIRPFFVWTADVLRKQTNGAYFPNLINGEVDERLKLGRYPIITDIRFIEYNLTDEYYWLQSKNGVLIYVERMDENGKLIQPANEVEEKNNRLLRENAELHLCIETYKSKKARDKQDVDLFELIEKYIFNHER